MTNIIDIGRKFLIRQLVSTFDDCSKIAQFPAREKYQILCDKLNKYKIGTARTNLYYKYILLIFYYLVYLYMKKLISIIFNFCGSSGVTIDLKVRGGGGCFRPGIVIINKLGKH